MLLPRYREVADEMSPYRQRVVYEGQPELSFYQLNGDKPLRWSKKREEGRQERRGLLEKNIPGADKILDGELGGSASKHLVDLAALLWTARRVFGHAAVRMPVEGEWDSEGLRQEIVY
jgi:predicted RNase H-like nuclease